MMLKKVTTWKQLTESIAIGIDVSKRFLDIVWLQGDMGYSRRIDNTSKSIVGFIGALDRQCFSGTILCEATSHYHVLLAVMLCESGYDIRVVNPLMSSKHAKSSIRKTKTDTVDARMLAVMVLTEPDLPQPAELTRDQCAVRHALGLIHSQEKHLQGMNRALASYSERINLLGIQTGEAFNDLKQAVKHLRKCHEALLVELETYLLEIQSDKKDLVDQVTLVPGITKRNAALLLNTLSPQVKSDKSWMAYAGLDVSIRQSGTWRGRGRITKRGPAWLRKRLVQAAWGASMNDPQAKQYYYHLKEKGRKHKEALVIMARKLLTVIYHLVVEGKQYDNTKVFQISN